MKASSSVVTRATSYPPDGFNPNAYNLINYRRPGAENTILYFPSRPDPGYDTLEQLVSAHGASALNGVQTRGMKPLVDEAAQVRTGGPDAPRGLVVPFVESVYPSAAIFNSGTGSWTSAQVQSAMATVDRSNVFRSLAGVAGQEAAGVVVESPNALADAARLVGGVSEKTVLASGLSPACMMVREATVSEILGDPTEVFEAAAAASPGRRVVLLPKTGLNAGQREVLVDGIFARGKLAFTAFSEKRRVDPEPPYLDRRITTLDNLDSKAASDLVRLVGEVLARLGVADAVFHAEFALTKRGFLLTDLMTRPGGGFIPEMVREKYGVDLRAAHVYAAFGMVEELERIAASAMDAGTHVAIAACYLEYIDDSRKGEAHAGAGLVNALRSDKRVVVYDVETVATNASVGLPDVRASLAVRGATADDALKSLDSLVARYGLN